MVAPLARTALGVAILIDVLRVFLPSLITIFGSAGSTPAELIGVYALSWFLGAFLAAAGARLLGGRVMALVGAVLLVAGRAVLQFTDGGQPQLYAASVALLGGLWWLTATASWAPHGLLTGVVWGFAVATGLHAALDTIDLVWRPGALPAAVVAVELAAFLALLLLPAKGDDSGAAPVPRAFLAVGPALLLWGQFFGNTAHAQASHGWEPAVAAVVVAVAGVVATLFAAAPRALTWHPAVPSVVLVASAAVFAFGAVTVDSVHGVSPWWTVPAQVVGVLALGACLGWAQAIPAAGGATGAPGGEAGGDRPYRRGLLMATGALLFMLFAFAYYAAYDLGATNDYVPIVVAACVAVLALVGSRATRETPTVRLRQPALAALAGAVVVAAAVALVPVWRAAPNGPVPPATGLRVAAYNVRMGFGLAGTMTIEQQADVLRSLDAHVIALSEVDRAWFLNGGHDGLRLIADRLGMQAIWAPAADEVWGDALLTNLPVTSVRNHVLVAGGPTGAQALEVGLRWQDRDITVIATHLQPPKNWEPLDQVEQLADIVRAAPDPVIVAGDLNLEPGEPAWNTLLAAGLTDAFADARPFVTIPSPNDEEQIDHILTTPGFTGVDPANPDVAWSDHRPIAVTLIRQG